MRLKALFTKDILPARAVPREIRCRKCHHTNELPFIFCEECGAPRVRLGHLRVTFNLSITMSAFILTYYWAEVFAWPWAFYALFSLLFLQVALMFVAESRIKAGRVTLWYMITLGVFGLLFNEWFSEGDYFIVLVLRDLPDLIMDNAGISYGIGGFVFAAIIVPVYLRWARIYGWVNAYRIAILSLFSLFLCAYLLLRGVAWVHAHGLLSDLSASMAAMVEKVNPQYEKTLRILAVNTFRIFLFEIFIFAALKGYAVSRHDIAALDRKVLKKESAVVRSALLIAQVLRRIGYAMEQMIRYLVETILHLSRDLLKVILAALREIFIPVTALVVAALMILHAARLTDAYIQENTVARAFSLLAIIVGLFACEALFLTCKSRYRFSRIAMVHGQFVGWLLPNVLVFFLLISVSLWASSMALGEYDKEGHRLPFHLGLLTKSVAVFLGLLVAVIVVRKRDVLLGRAQPADAAPTPGEDEEPPLFDQETPIIEDDEDLGIKTENTEDEKPDYVYSGFRDRKAWDLGHRQPSAGESEASKGKLSDLLGKARGALDKSSVGRNARRMLDDVQDRMKGRPEIVKQYVINHEKLQDALRRLGALEETRQSISTDLYDTLRKQYNTDAEALARKQRQIQAKIDLEYSNERVECHNLQKRLEDLGKQEKELDRLAAVGAIDKREFSTRGQSVQAQISYAKGVLANHQKKMEFLAPFAEADSLSRPVSREDEHETTASNQT